MSIDYNWIVAIDGWVYNQQMERIGYFDTDGTVYTPDLGMKYGFVDINGDTYGQLNAPRGFVDIDGTIYNEIRMVIGYVDANGIVGDASKEPIGSVRKKIHQKLRKKEIEHNWRKTIYRAAAGVVLLLQTK